MSFFEWSDELSVNHQNMDNQHQTLIRYVNEFYDLVARDATQAELITCFDRIVDFTSFHFAAEEAVMEENKFPGIRQHKLIHESLVKRVMELKQSLLNEEDNVRNDIKFFLKNWLTSHIKGIDKKYAEHIHQTSQPTLRSQC